jgi:hypothetical protein
VGSAGGDYHVVNRSWAILEKRPSCGTLRVELERCLLEALGIAPCEDNAGAFSAGSPGSFYLGRRRR